MWIARREGRDNQANILELMVIENDGIDYTGSNPSNRRRYN